VAVATIAVIGIVVVATISLAKVFGVFRVIRLVKIEAEMSFRWRSIGVVVIVASGESLFEVMTVAIATVGVTVVLIVVVVVVLWNGTSVSRRSLFAHIVIELSCDLVEKVFTQVDVVEPALDYRRTLSEDRQQVHRAFVSDRLVV